MGKVIYAVCSVLVCSVAAFVQQHEQQYTTKDLSAQRIEAIATKFVDRLGVAYRPRIVKTSYVKPDGSRGEKKTTIKTPNDIFFVVDTSGSIGRRNFNTLKKFMKALVESTIIGPQRHHAGVVTFATRSQIRVNYIQSTKSHCHFLNEINRLPYSGGWTNTKAGFSWIKTLIQQSFSNRPQSKKIVFYLTDGNWNHGGNPNSMIDAVKNLGDGDGQVTIFSMGIGNVNEAHLKYASTFDYWERIPTFSSFRKLVKSIHSKLKVIKLSKVVEFQYDGVSSSDCGRSGSSRLCLYGRCGCQRCACQISTGKFVCKNYFIDYPHRKVPLSHRLKANHELELMAAQ